MKRSLILFLLLSLVILSSIANAQKSRTRKKSKSKKDEGNPAIIIDRRLSVLRNRPSLYALPIQRMSVGREVSVLGEKKGDGVLFYRVRVSANRVGWMQSEAIIASFRRGDDKRLAKLILATDGFDRISKSVIFLKLFPKSPIQPTILLLAGDAVEAKASKLSKKAAQSLDRSEMAASGAPLHSFYLNFSSLDRYRKAGIRFLFNINTKSYHYDGAFWLEVLRKYPKTAEAEEAKKKLNTLRENMEKK